MDPARKGLLWSMNFGGPCCADIRGHPPPEPASRAAQRLKESRMMMDDRKGRPEVDRNVAANSSAITRSTAIRTVRVGASAVGALALGAVALGAIAIGALAVGRLVVGRARIGRLEIDELVVGRLVVRDRRP
jgi:hypothetical protein